MNKETTYTALLPQIAALIKGESNETSVLANVAAALHQAFEPFFWTGFYLLHPDGMLRLGPFQGPPACYAIAIGKGVCGQAFELGRTLVVPDVEQFPGHIACSALSRSEIVVPVFAKSGKPVAVLDSCSPTRYIKQHIAYAPPTLPLMYTYYYIYIHEGIETNHKQKC